MIILRERNGSNEKELRNDNRILCMKPAKSINVPPLGHLEKSVVYLFYEGLYNCAGILLNEHLCLDQYANYLECCSVDSLYLVDLDIRFGGSKEWQTPFVVSPPSARMRFPGGVFYKDKLIRVSRLSSSALRTTNIRNILENQEGSFKPFLTFGWMNWPSESFDQQIGEYWSACQANDLSILDLGKSDMWYDAMRRL